MIAAMAEPFAEIDWQSHDGLRLYARDYAGPAADAATVLCLHGLTRNSRDFEDLAPHLATAYRVIVPDLRGRGRSARDPHWQNYHPGTYVSDVLALLAAADVSRIAVIGTSLGGLLAMMLGYSHRARIAGIILNDVGPELDPVGIERIKQYAGRLAPVRTWPEAVEQLRAVYGDAWPGIPAERWAALARRSYRENAAGIVEVDADPNIGEALRAAPAVTLDLWPLWKALGTLPTLAIRGANSDLLSATTFARMKSENPDVRQLLVANRGHVPLLDEPECLAAIDDFLTQLR